MDILLINFNFTKCLNAGREVTMFYTLQNTYMLSKAEYIKAVTSNFVKVTTNINSAKRFTSKRNAKRFMQKHIALLSTCTITANK
jgi:predicted peroxiredoxin